MLKKILIIVAFLYFCAFGLVFEDNGADTLSAEQKFHISYLVIKHHKEIDDEKIKFGIISETKNDVQSKTPNLIKSYIIDSLGLNEDAILEKYYDFTPSLEVPLKPVRPNYLEIYPLSNLVRMELITILDSANISRKNDTVTVSENGFALIHFNNNHRITLHSNAKISVSHSYIQQFKGDISVSQSNEIFAGQYMKPLNIKTDKGEIFLDGDAFISLGKFTVLQVYKGTAIFKRGEIADTITAGNAISISNNLKQIVTQPILDSPLLFEKSAFTLLPGELFNYKNTSDFKQRIIVASEKNEIIADTTTVADGISLTLGYGKRRFFVQDIDTAGIISNWAQKDINIREIKGLKSLEIFDDTLYYTTDDRPFTFRGVADTAVKIFIDREEVPLAKNGDFSKKVMLKDSLNYPEIVVLYKDLSGDTISPTIFYTGFDERITMNDSIMGKPAFTIGRQYKWQIFAPTAVNVSINNEKIEPKESAQNEDGYYEKAIRAWAFTEYPVIINVDYENSNSKTFTRTFTREKYATSSELGVREFMLMVAVASFISAASMVTLFGGN
ncbi:MAG: hypothetical protein FWF51_06350 [Chitinivibrionia bacterium]|nr:hypothetical protein [Chitinivibrionia bacterium]